MTTTTLPVFDSAEWVVDEFEAEIMGGVYLSDEEYNALRAAAIKYVSWSLALHWFHQGRKVKLVPATEYHQGTRDDEAVNVTASSHYLPDAEEALGLWEGIAASVTPDEIRRFAGLA